LTPDKARRAPLACKDIGDRGAFASPTTKASHRPGRIGLLRRNAQGVIMNISIMRYKGYEFRAYFQQTYPTLHDPYVTGPRRYSSIVRIDTVPSGIDSVRRYATPVVGESPTRAVDAIEQAMQYAKDIVDGKVKPLEL
jgi:hypothetical protein